MKINNNDFLKKRRENALKNKGKRKLALRIFNGSVVLAFAMFIFYALHKQDEVYQETSAILEKDLKKIRASGAKIEGVKYKNSNEKNDFEVNADTLQQNKESLNVKNYRINNENYILKGSKALIDNNKKVIKTEGITNVDIKNIGTLKADNINLDLKKKIIEGNDGVTIKNDNSDIKANSFIVDKENEKVDLNGNVELNLNVRKKNKIDNNDNKIQNVNIKSEKITLDKKTENIEAKGRVRVIISDEEDSSN